MYEEFCNIYVQFNGTDYLNTQILFGTLINVNPGHSTLIYLALINVVCKFS